MYMLQQKLNETGGGNFMWEFEDSKERQNPVEGMDVRSSRTRNLQPTGQVEEHLLYGVEHKGRERQDPEGEI